MRFWLSRQNDVPIREQLVQQVKLGVLGGDLLPGAKLPSTREMARRFAVHANTVSGAYTQLAQEGWLEFRKGSGVYVPNARSSRPAKVGDELDAGIGKLFREAREAGVSMAALRERLRVWLAAQPPDHFLLFEPDDALAEIVTAEITAGTSLPVVRCNEQVDNLADLLTAAIPLVLPSRAEALHRKLPDGTECITLQINSAPASLATWMPKKTPAVSQQLIGIASGWPGFLQSARTMLVAAGFDPDTILARDTAKAGWQKGLTETLVVVSDTVAAKKLPGGCRCIQFPLLAAATIDELRKYESFTHSPEMTNHASARTGAPRKRRAAKRS